jgi:PAS domain S-box-containing protein
MATPRGRTLLALIPPVVTFVIQLAGWELFRPYAWFMFVPSVTLSAAIAGFRGGLIATAISTVLVWWFFLPPEQELAKEARLVVPTCVFFVTGTMIAAVAERAIRANERLRRVSDERRMFENEVAAKSADLARAQSVAQIGSWRLDIQSNELRWSEEAYRMFGVPPGTPMTYESFLACVHPDDRLYVDRMWNDALGGAPYDIEHRLLIAGEVRWVREKAELELDDRGSLVGGIGIVQDITERKRAEVELQLANETTSAILSTAADGIISLDEHQTITMFNEAAEKIFGYAKAEVIGAHLDKLIPDRLRAMHRNHVEKFAAGPNQTKQMDTRTVELIGRRKNGDEFPAEIAVSKLEIGGRRLLTATVRDVTAQRRAEHEQRFLAETGPILASSLEYERTIDRVAQLAVRELADLCVVDIVSLDGKVQRLKVTCRDPARAWIADGLMRIELDQSRPFLTQSSLETREPLVFEHLTDATLETYAQNANHLKLLRALEPASMLTVPLLAHGNLLGAIALVASVSSPRLGPADLQLAQELARRAALAIESARLYATAQGAIQARNDALGVVAHDLRNPLNAISLQGELLRQHEGRERKIGESLQRSVARMNRLIQDILDVTRLEAGQLTLERQRVSTVQAVLDVVETQRPIAEARRLALLVEIDPDVPEIWADRERLLQIFENLVSNALKFTSHGSVTIGAARRDSDVLIWVRDTGCGIGPEALLHVFDRFWKADTNVRRGLGLGLAIVKGLVEAHGGKIWVESAPDAGACFYFTMPIAPPLETWESASLR